MPTTSDANSDALGFGICTPTSAYLGTYAGIKINVCDGKVSASLISFSINEVAAATTTGSASTNLAGYKSHYGTSGTISVGIGLRIYVISNLPSGTWYFAISAVNSSGIESSLSDIASKTI